VTIAPPGAKAITAFSFTKAKNASLPGDVTATINGTAIAATVPFGTDVTALIATFATTGASVSVGATLQVSGTTPNNFTAPVVYKAKATDATTQDYTVTVTIAPNTAKAITAYSFTTVNNPGLAADVTATINGTAIAATVPFGTDVTALVATITSTGASVAVGATAQVSGTTPNNFAAPVIYRVTAADGSTQDFTVTVSVALNSAKAITAYAFLSANNNVAIPVDVIATINGTAISATVPFGTQVTGLIATFTTTGAGVAVGAIAQVSDATPNDFTNPVTYTVTAADGSTAAFIVTVTIAPSPAKEITAYAFLSTQNPGLLADVTATINGTAIAATVPFGTDISALVATFTSTSPSVAVGATAQISGTTPNNFTAPVIYRITAADGTTQDFTVTVTVALSPAKAITAYAFLSVSNAGLAADVTATINGTAISASVPFGTSVTALVATFTSTGASVTVGGITQTSGLTANDFTAPVAYLVTAADGSTLVFTVTVTVSSNTAKEITDYAFLSASNPDLAADVTATINGTAIAATVPFGTTVTALVATFASTGASVAVGGTAQTSGATPNDFTAPVTYRVTAADGSTRDFTVTVTVALNPAKAITAYAFLSVNNAGLLADVTATINGTAIAATVPFGTTVTSLIATFATTGASVAVGATAQTSGITPNDFTAQVDYTVTAADGSTAVFTVTVTVAPSPAKEITSYQFLTVNNAGLAADITATIAGTAITATVPFGTNLTALVATFATTGASVTVGGITQTSGATPNDFTAPVVYRVTAADGSTQDFTVTISVALSPAKAITAYAFLSVNNPGLTADVTATITGNAIAATLPFGTSPAAVTSLIATFATTGASVAVGATAQVSGATANDFTAPVAYLVTAADGSTATFTVTVTIGLNPAKDITAFSFASGAANPGLVATSAGTITGTAIAVAVQPGLGLTALVATFTSTGASVTVGGTAQVSGATANDFTSPVTYTVTAADGSTQDFVVTVTPLVASFSFTGAAGNELTFASDGTNAKLAGVPTMARQGGAPTIAGGAFSGNGWNAVALDLAHYYTFTVTPAAGETMTLTNLAFKNQRSGTGPSTWVLRSSVDGFATDLANLATPPPVTLVRNDVALGAGFANLTAPVELRFYAFGASSPNGTWRIDDVLLFGSLTP
jgi:hypothetical protein